MDIHGKTMFHFSFKEWLLIELSKTSPEGAGEIWDNRSNADLDFGRTGAKSKNVMAGTKAGQTDFDPEQLFLGKKKKSGTCLKQNREAE